MLVHIHLDEIKERSGYCIGEFKPLGLREYDKPDAQRSCACGDSRSGGGIRSPCRKNDAGCEAAYYYRGTVNVHEWTTSLQESALTVNRVKNVNIAELTALT